jgi:predicted small metal-binding protein
MSKLINCECGQVLRGKTDDELVAGVVDHVNQDHPELVGKISREDILAMAEEDPATTSNT